MGPSVVGRRPERLRGRRSKDGGEDEDSGINLNMGKQRKGGQAAAAATAAAAAAAAWTVSSQKVRLRPSAKKQSGWTLRARQNST